jgi:hypothetical protein
MKYGECIHGNNLATCTTCKGTDVIDYTLLIKKDGVSRNHHIVLADDTGRGDTFYIDVARDVLWENETHLLVQEPDRLKSPVLINMATGVCSSEELEFYLATNIIYTQA